ncbi:hypothetical protein C4F50_23095 [Flavobacterium sp. KB82]|uniref:Lipoprotein n=1 Tax=Flavobacterium hungaricum TaxID=2082725 RepID=A0ABR9TR12_9FLAO|nr:hypothetical protein [Flavobacterium hungaricum]
MLIACNSRNEKVKEAAKTITKDTSAVVETKKKPDDKSVYDSKFIEKENILINGNKVIVSKQEFESIYTKIDSTKTQIWECGSPFEWLDEKWMIKTYGQKTSDMGTFKTFNGEITTIYTQNIQFATNNHIVLFDTGFADQNSFKIISHNITLDKNTTLKEFRKKFPNAEMEKTENENEVRFRFYLDKVTDDAFLFYFKDGKLNYVTLWWLLC